MSGVRPSVHSTPLLSTSPRPGSIPLSPAWLQAGKGSLGSLGREPSGQRPPPSGQQQQQAGLDLQSRPPAGPSRGWREDEREAPPPPSGRAAVGGGARGGGGGWNSAAAGQQPTSVPAPPASNPGSRTQSQRTWNDGGSAVAGKPEVRAPRRRPARARSRRLCRAPSPSLAAALTHSCPPLCSHLAVDSSAAGHGRRGRARGRQRPRSLGRAALGAAGRRGGG